MTADASGIASATFTAGNSIVTCRVTASAGAVVTFDVITYRPEALAVVTTTSPAIPRAGEPFLLNVSLMLGVYTLRDVDLSVYRSSGINPAFNPGSGNTGQSGVLPINVIPDRVGDLTIEVAIGSRVQPVSIRFDAATLALQDMWWTQPQENGWGIAMLQHRDTLVMVIFSYDAAGKPVWYVMPGGAWDATRQVYTGSLYRPRGSPFYAYDAARFAPGSSVGPVKLTFTDGSHARMEGSIDAQAFTRTITRMNFGVFHIETFPDQTDLWWGGSAQNGWGLSVIQQYNTFFSAWYTYDADGNATWYVMPGGSFTDGQTYEGRIFKTVGSPFIGGAYDPSRFVATDVGPYRLRLLGVNGAMTFEYSIEGRTGTITLSRQPF